MHQNKHSPGLIEKLIQFQRRHYTVILLCGLLLSLVCFKRATKLLSTVATDLIHLLPDHYPNVKLTDEIRSRFNRRSSLYVILESPSQIANEKALLDLKVFLEKHPEVSEAETEKQGYDFIDKNKLLLAEMEDLQKVHDKLKDKIEKEKLGALYIDLEDAGSPQDQSFEELARGYKDKYTQGVESRYRRNKAGTVYVIDIYTKSSDSGLKFFKHFGEEIDRYLKGFDFKKYHPDLRYGYAGAIKTRVDQYDALMEDLKTGGAISLGSIFVVLYFYFSISVRRGPGLAGFFKAVLLRFSLVTMVFIPMIYSTLIAFAFCSFFFSQLNVVTSFLFAIIFGLGVDIGIHLMTRYIQDRKAGLDTESVHRNIVLKTGKSCATSILTTVSSFYVLIITDFKGFSDFGWIAGNGLVIALLCYLLFQPCLLLLADKLHLFDRKNFKTDESDPPEKAKRIPFAKPVLFACFATALVSALLITRVPFEWDFNKLKLKLAEREEQKSMLRETINRVNSPAAYLVNGPDEARMLRGIIRERRAKKGEKTTIQFFSSYYDLVPEDQHEKIRLLKKIETMLRDDALNSLNDKDRKLVAEMRAAIANTRPVSEKDIPPDIAEVFWGTERRDNVSIAYVMPKANLELDNGINARRFFEEVGVIESGEKKFYAVSDSIVFAQVLETLFRDSKIAIVLSALLLAGMIALHYRNVKKTGFILGGLLCGILWMFSLMETFGIKLNFYNMIVIPAMIGMGEDNSVQILDRFEEEKRSSIVRVLRTAGGACFMASLCTILGYGGLCFTRHPGLNSIGWMAVTGMTTCLLGSLVVLPLLLQVFLKPKKH